MPDSTAAARASTARFGPVPKRVVVEDGSKLARKAWQMLEAESKDLGLPHLRTRPLKEFLAAAERRKMSRKDKETIVDQSIVMIENLYPHLPFKKRIYSNVSPLERLNGIRERLDALGETKFHSEVILAFSSVVDAHTLYGLPPPYRDATAFVPFQMRAYIGEDELPHFVVTKLMKTQKNGGFGHPFFIVGAEITHWNFRLTKEYVEDSQGRLPGTNPLAKLARGSIFATVRPLTFCEPPDDMDVTLHYIAPGSSDVGAIRFPWGVATGLDAGAGLPGSAFSVSVSTGAVSAAERMLMHRDEMHEQRRIEAAFTLRPGSPFIAAPLSPATPSARGSRSRSDLQQVSKIFDFQFTGGDARPGSLDPASLRDDGHPRAKFGYIRILNFRTFGGGDDLVNEFRRILAEVMNKKAPDGLILDIRGNPGGNIQAAERMLQMLTPAKITPIRFHFANTPSVREIFSRLREIIRSRNEQRANLLLQEFRPWLRDPDRAAAEELTAGHPLTTREKANEIGQVYRGPCVLLTDSLTYSAADIFAAGFQDNAIGPVIGLSTGAGGGNVWSHDDLLQLFEAGPNGAVQPLPKGATLSLAIRRCSRVGPRKGEPVEDLGVRPDVIYLPASPADLLTDSPGLIRLACKLLCSGKRFRVRIRRAELRKDIVHVELQTANIRSLDFYLNGPKALSSEVQPGSSQSFDVPVPPENPSPVEVLVKGYARLPGAAGTELVLAATDVARISE